MNHAQNDKAPIHLWIVGVLALLWSAMNCTDYYMIRTRNIDWISQTPGISAEDMLAWVDSFPVWAQLGWALCVWMGLAGSALLLMRHRWAPSAFALSLLGAMIGLANKFLGSPPPPPFDQGFMSYMPMVIIAVAAAFTYYAHRQKLAGILS